MPSNFVYCLPAFEFAQPSKGCIKCLSGSIQYMPNNIGLNFPIIISLSQLPTHFSMPLFFLLFFQRVPGPQASNILQVFIKHAESGNAIKIDQLPRFLIFWLNFIAVFYFFSDNPIAQSAPKDRKPSELQRMPALIRIQLSGIHEKNFVF
jgi:hypothetical protein